MKVLTFFSLFFYSFVCEYVLNRIKTLLMLEALLFLPSLCIYPTV
ncbi:hypothetical protein SLEP1_g43585 [Rubroshorea leprosula]|uniref:Uncharacterized protein n=1 Tax=Rubroshorea leprosula TaxID=152421 RepID=A0AAV5LDE8_9ROSI|nr:hypothetical protein SLEP1_g43585 [Rubroshorea leprosula]